MCHSQIISLLGLLLCSFPATAATTFTNPLLDSGADPSVVYHDGFYFYTQTTGHNLTIWKTQDITDLRHATKKIVWTPPPDGPDSHEIWAPELHFIDGNWFLYFAADSGSNETHRLFVLENKSPDPLSGRWRFKGEVHDSTDKWAIDPTVFENQGKLYMLWSGWPGDRNGEQDIYIARLKKPWKVGGPRVRLSSPQFPWEEHGGETPPNVNVNEGPEILQHDDKIFLIYSASGCWTDYYALGMLTASNDSDLLDPASWHKAPQPVLKGSAEANAVSTGHNTFFKSPDGKEDWILYHANPDPGQGCGNHRSPRAQPFTWNSDGNPQFGAPVPLDTPLSKPSGTQP